MLMVTAGRRVRWRRDVLNGKVLWVFTNQEVMTELRPRLRAPPRRSPRASSLILPHVQGHWSEMRLRQLQVVYPRTRSSPFVQNVSGSTPPCRQAILLHRPKMNNKEAWQSRLLHLRIQHYHLERYYYPAPCDERSESENHIQQN